MEISDYKILREKAREWIEWDPCLETKNQIVDLLEKDDLSGLRRAFGSRVEFGTAGLRAEMVAGPSGINDLVIIQTAQGLCQYLQKVLGIDVVRQRGIVVGFDHRARGMLNSKRFALITAAVFLSHGIKVYLFKDFVATPFVPFAGKLYSTVAGVMVTASHNPKNDNGFKVYWENACQIIPPNDIGIAESIQANLAPWSTIDFAGLTEESLYQNPSNKQLLHDPLDEVMDSYYKSIVAKMCRHRDSNGTSAASIKTTYTAMHGVGFPYAKRAFEAFGFEPFAFVDLQCTADPLFPTVEYPNPEEGAGALSMSIELSNRVGSTLILANDPDADRLAVAEKCEKSGEWRIFNGNEIGALLADWEWRNYKQKDKSCKSPKGAAMIASTVSSKMVRAIAKKEGFYFEECLTGFKWLGNAALRLEREGYDVLFSFEQAIGFCVGNNVQDKDGISTLAVFSEMAGQLKAEMGRSCAEHLESLREKYGHFVSNDGYVLCHDDEKISTVFSNIRNGGKYINSLLDGKYPIVSIRDLRSPGYDSSTANKAPTLPVGDDDMISLEFDNGCVITLRVSGTEPKVKYYAEMSGKDPVKVEEELSDMVENGVKKGFLKPLFN